VVVAQDPPLAGQGVLVQLPRPLMLPQRAQVDGAVTDGAKGIGVVVAQDPPLAGQGVLVQLPRPLMLLPTRAGRRRGCWSPWWPGSRWVSGTE
jgi:hypothetical protein